MKPFGLRSHRRRWQSPWSLPGRASVLGFSLRCAALQIPAFQFSCARSARGVLFCIPDDVGLVRDIRKVPDVGWVWTAVCLR